MEHSSTAGLPSRVLLGAFVGVALSFLAVSVYTHISLRQIDSASEIITRDTAPSIEYLAAARGHLVHLDGLMSQYLHIDSDTVLERDDVIAAMNGAEREVRRYLAVPVSPGEEEIYDEVSSALHEVLTSARHVLDLANAGTLERARTAYRVELKRALARSSRAVTVDLAFNARHGSAAATQMKEVRRRALFIGLGLDALCVAVTAITWIMVKRQLRRHATLLATHTRFLEARSHELEIFSGRVAHDIVNPVGAAQILVDVALRQGSGESNEALKGAQRSLRRAQSLILGLLRFARAGATPAPGASADVHKVVEDVVKSAKDGDSSGAEVHWAAQPCAAACDPGVLTSIVSNLLDNALKYLGDGPVRRVDVRAKVRDGTVRIEVQDSGPGIDGELLVKVFDPYVRGSGHSKPGLGLGLATVKRLVEGHGGQVGVESEPGRGSMFWVELPGVSARTVEPALSAVAS